MPDAAGPRARYAVAALLDGLALTPAWTDSPLDPGAALYVGTRPEASGAGVRLRLRPEAILAVERAEVGRTGRLVHRDRRWALPVGPRGEHAPAPGAVVEAAVVESAFWWLAGVGEAAGARDRHGRARRDGHLAADLDVRDGPAVDGYRRWLADALGAAGTAVRPRTWGGAPWAVALTSDVDALGARRLRGLAGGLARGQVVPALRRALGPDAATAGTRALAALARRHRTLAGGSAATFFWKAGATAPEDVPHRLPGRLVRALAAEGVEPGLHPSYHAHAHPLRLADERDRVARAAGRAPTAVRSHYLRWTEGATPAAYAGAGFALDSTLGWAEAPGFRRGTATPFRLWDAAAERPSALREWPLALMDTSLFTHLGLTDAEAADRLDGVLDAARAVGGGAVLLWHPPMAEDSLWTRRLDVLDHAVGRARAAGAAVGGLSALVAAWDGPAGADRAPAGPAGT